MLYFGGSYVIISVDDEKRAADLALLSEKVDEIKARYSVYADDRDAAIRAMRAEVQRVLDHELDADEFHAGVRARRRVRLLQLLRHLRDLPPHRRQRRSARRRRDQGPARQGRQARRRLHRPRPQGRRSRQEQHRPRLGAVQEHHPARRGRRRDALPADGAHVRARLGLRARELRRVLQGRHRRRGGARAAHAGRPRGRGRGAQARHRHRQGPAPEPRRQAPARDVGVPALGQPPRVDDPRRHPGDPAGAAPHGAARRRPLRDERPERPLPPGHQPQQPPQAAARPAGARHHRQQREAHAAGGGRRPVRQRPPRPRRDGPRQPRPQVAVRHAQGQAGPLPPEPARQARRLLGPFGHRGRPAPEDAPVRPAQDDGSRAVQAVHHEPPRQPQARAEHQGRQEDGRVDGARGLGHPRRGHRRAPGAAQPRADPPPPGHPGLRAAARRGQGHPDPSAGLRGLQRRLRRRPDGRPSAAVVGGAGRSPHAHAVDQQHPLAGQRQAHRRAVAGHGHRRLLPHVPPARRPEQGEGRRLRRDAAGLRQLRRGRAGLRAAPARSASGARAARAAGIAEFTRKHHQAASRRRQPRDHHGRSGDLQHGGRERAARAARRRLRPDELHVPERQRHQEGPRRLHQRARGRLRRDQGRPPARRLQGGRLPLRHAGGGDRLEERRRDPREAQGRDPDRARGHGHADPGAVQQRLPDRRRAPREDRGDLARGRRADHGAPREPTSTRSTRST